MNIVSPMFILFSMSVPSSPVGYEDIDSAPVYDDVDVDTEIGSHMEVKESFEDIDYTEEGTVSPDIGERNGFWIPGLDWLLNQLIVETNHGKVRGFHAKSRKGFDYIHFRAIPYARPPIGDLRYEPPQPYGSWNGVFDATRNSPLCLQIYMYLIVGKEDCLTLEVATRHISKNHDELLPVIVWIHGGLFHIGGSVYFPPKYMMDENIVLVTMNYRLGSFGFLNTEDNTVTGNQGLKDQVLALQWVRENIRNFGGNPMKVTIMGESAGSASVHFHTLSPMSRGLFHRAIAQSGTALSPWALIEDPLEQAMDLAKNVGCFGGSTRHMVRCLKRVDMYKIISLDSVIMWKFIKGERNSLYGPSIEKGSRHPFIDKRPIEYMRAGHMAKVPLILGVNSGEGLIYMINIAMEKAFGDYVNNNFYKVFERVFNLWNHPNAAQVLHKIKERYLGGGRIQNSNIKKAAKMVSDGCFYLDNHDVALAHSNVAPVYAYFYDHHGRFSQGDLFFTNHKILGAPNVDFAIGVLKEWFSSWMFNRRINDGLDVAHGDELAIFFNIPKIRVEIQHGDQDYEFSTMMVALVADFARHGIPDRSHNILPHGLRWRSIKDKNPNLEEEALARLYFGTKNGDVKLIDEPFYSDLKFWRDKRSHV